MLSSQFLYSGLWTSNVAVLLLSLTELIVSIEHIAKLKSTVTNWTNFNFVSIQFHLPYVCHICTHSETLSKPLCNNWQSSTVLALLYNFVSSANLFMILSHHVFVWYWITKTTRKILCGIFRMPNNPNEDGELAHAIGDDSWGTNPCWLFWNNGILKHVIQ